MSIDLPRPVIIDLLYNEYCFQLSSHVNSRGTSVFVFFVGFQQIQNIRYFKFVQRDIGCVNVLSYRCNGGSVNALIATFDVSLVGKVNASCFSHLYRYLFIFFMK